MKKYSLIYLVLCVPFFLSAQLNAVYDDDMNAISISAGLEKGKEVDGLSVDLGLAISKHFEVDASFIRSNFNTQDQYTYDGYINGLSGTLTWWWLSRNLSSNTSLSLGVKGGVESFDYKNYWYWKDEDYFFEYDGYSVVKLGLDMGLNHWIDSRYIVRPFASAFYEFGKSATIFQYSDENDVCQGVTGKVGAYFMRKLNYNDALFLSPSLLFNYHERKAPVMFNLSFGLMVGY